MVGELLTYGIAINFLGNYKQEAGQIDGIMGRIDGQLRNLTQMFIGGSIAYGFQRFVGNIISTGKMMEMQFAQIKGVLGDVGKTMETLQWAKMKGVTTSLSDTEVVDAVVAMTRMGLAKEKAERDKNFDALADFTAMYLKPKGFTFADAVDMVSKASFGNWERLGDNFGMRKQTIGTQWKSAVQAKGITDEATSPDKFTKEDVARGDKLVALLQKAKTGTEEYKKSLVDLLGLMSKGGMLATMETFGGVMSNIMEIPEGFMKSFVGYAQVSGTLWNAVVTQLRAFFGVLSQAAENGETAIGNFFRFASDIGGLFVSDINNMGNSLKEWAEKLRSYFLDYQNKIAPIILFLALVKIQVQEFLKAFYEGFRSTFDWFIKAAVGVWGFFIELLKFFGLVDENGKGVAKVLGQIMGLLVGIRVFKMIVSPLHQLDLMAGQLLPKIGQVLKGFDQIIFKGRIFAGLQRMAGGNIASGTTLITGAFARIGTSISGATSALLAFLATPVGAIVAVLVVIVAWVAYLVMNWEKVRENMQGVSDIALVILSIFSPIIGIPLLMAKHWESFKKIFTNIWHTLRDTMIGVWNYSKIAFDKFWTGILNSFPALRIAIDGIKTLWKGVIDMVSNWWKSLTESDFMKSILNKVEKWTSGSADWAKKFRENSERELADHENKTNPDQRDKYKSIGTGNKVLPNNSVATTYTIQSMTIKADDPNKFGKGLNDYFQQGAMKAGAMGVG